MARIRILKAAEQHSVRVSNNSQHADIPIDGQFHDIHDDLVPVLESSAVEFENADATGGPAAAGGAAGLGGSAASLTRKRVRKSRAKAKK